MCCSLAIILLLLHLQKGSVVQLYRTSDSGSEGHGLESRRGHEKSFVNNLFTKDFVFDIFSPLQNE